VEHFCSQPSATSQRARVIRPGPSLFFSHPLPGVGCRTTYLSRRIFDPARLAREHRRPSRTRAHCPVRGLRAPSLKKQRGRAPADARRMATSHRGAAPRPDRQISADPGCHPHSPIPPRPAPVSASPLPVRPSPPPPSRGGLPLLSHSPPTSLVSGPREGGSFSGARGSILLSLYTTPGPLFESTGGSFLESAEGRSIMEHLRASGHTVVPLHHPWFRECRVLCLRGVGDSRSCSVHP
jgi:hypothetical protein